MLKAGVGRANITPPFHIPNGMWVAQKHIMAEGLHQDLWVTALALADDTERIVLLDFDLCLLSEAQVRNIRAAVVQATGIDGSRVFVFCTHNHAGPITQDTYAGEGEEVVRSYIRSLPGYAAGVARTAMMEMVSVRVAAGSGSSDIGVNRDLPLPDGRIVAGPNPDGFSDREVGVVRFDREDGTPFVCLLNYACHPTVLGPDNKRISPDYPGSAKRMVERTTGATCLFLQGAAGNMGPVEGFVGDAAVAERLGGRLGLEAAKVFMSLRTSPTVSVLEGIIESGAPLTRYADVPVEREPDTLRVRSTLVRLPIRDPLPDVYEKAVERMVRWQKEARRLTDAGADYGEIALLHQRVEREKLRIARCAEYKAQPDKAVELHVIAIGGIAIVAMWGEPYCEIGAEVKRLSPFAHTLFAAYLGSDPIYIATPDMYLPKPPFEVDNSPFSPEAASVTVESALRLLTELSGEGRSFDSRETLRK